MLEEDDNNFGHDHDDDASSPVPAYQDKGYQPLIKVEPTPLFCAACE
jgi:hypothetical protein